MERMTHYEDHGGEIERPEKVALTGQRDGK
jgi:hypothetical protein